MGGGREPGRAPRRCRRRGRHRQVYDAANRRPLGEPYRLRGGGVNKLRFSPDGSTLAVAGGESLKAPRAWFDLIDPRTRERKQRVVLPPTRIRPILRGAGLVFLPGGRDLVVEQNHYDSLDAPASS